MDWNKTLDAISISLKDDLVAVKEEFAGYIPTLLSRNTGNCEYNRGSII